jgi:hypothetical protein
MIYYPPLSDSNKAIVEKLYNYQTELFDTLNEEGVQKIVDEIYELLVNAITPYYRLHDGRQRNSDPQKTNMLEVLKLDTQNFTDESRIGVILSINILATMYDPQNELANQNIIRD